MAASSDNNGPAQRPVQITSLSKIIAEGNHEIGHQVREAVEQAVTAGIAVDPVRLRKWGAGGAEYFTKKLQERIMPPPQVVGPEAGRSSPDAGAVPAAAGTPANDSPSPHCR